MKTAHLVLAGTHAQAMEYARKFGWKKDQWHYVFSIDDLRGMRSATLHKVGTFWRRYDCSEIEDMWRCYGGKEALEHA
jgi:hypothetical protein